MRILFYTYTPPIPSWGGAMTFYRHFIERDDFKIMVITTDTSANDYSIDYSPVLISLPAWWQRISRTRFLPFIYVIEALFGNYFLSSKIVDESKAFNPDAIFTVAGSWDWTALAAHKLAKKLNVPLIASFNDWFDYGWFPAHKAFYKIIERRFRRFYVEADLALVTSDGMRAALGYHKNVHVLYPTGAEKPKQLKETNDGSSNFTVFFGGNLGEWYGKMLEDLVLYCSKEYPEITFAIYGGNPSWSDDFTCFAKEKNYYRGRVSFEDLKIAANDAEILLLPMGFDPEIAQVEKTSFKTKFLDYIIFDKPIIVWGPEYCTAVQIAKEFDSAECVTDSNAKACAKAIFSLLENPNRKDELRKNAQKMYEDRFNPLMIHKGLVKAIQSTIFNYLKSE